MKHIQTRVINLGYVNRQGNTMYVLDVFARCPSNRYGLIEGIWRSLPTAISDSDWKYYKGPSFDFFNLKKRSRV